MNALRLPSEIGLGSAEFLVNGITEEMSRLRIRARPALHPETRAAAAYCEGGAEAADQARREGYTTWGRTAHVALVAGTELRRHVAAFITLDSLEYDLDRLGDSYAELIAAAQRRFGLPTIAQVLRALAQEGVSVLNLISILEAMLAVETTVDADFNNVISPYAVALCPAVFGEQIQDVEWRGYAECVRTQLRDYISHKYSAGRSTLSVYLLDPEIESRLARAHLHAPTELESTEILGALEATIGRIATNRRPIVLTAIEARRRFKELIEVEFPDVPVLAYQELSPELRIQRLGEVALHQQRSGRGIANSAN